MSESAAQFPFQMDEITKSRAICICSRLGIDVPTYLRMSLARLVEENGIPFSTKFSSDISAVSAMERCQRRAEEAGISGMTLDEINEEIRLARESSNGELEAFSKRAVCCFAAQNA